MKVLYGSELGPVLWKGYTEEMVPALLSEAPPMLVEREKEMDQVVDIDRVGPARPENTTPGDAAMLDAQVSKKRMYKVRVRDPESELGLRFDGVVWTGERWAMLFKLYNYLPDPDAEPDAQVPAGSADAGAPAAP
jgi:hypothetical protein